MRVAVLLVLLLLPIPSAYAQSGQAEICWSISQWPDGRDAVRLQLSGSEVSESGLGLHQTRSISATESEKIESCFKQIQRCPTFDMKNTEDPQSVLYTFISIRQGDHSVKYRWKGLGVDEESAILALFSSPIGAEGKQILDKLLQSKQTKLTKQILDKRLKTGLCPLDIVLENGSAKEMLPLLSYKFPKIRFELNPKLNGYLVYGTLTDVLHLQHSRAQWDLVRPSLSKSSGV